jgi:hypothetical protein
MTTAAPPRDALARFFRRHQIADIDQLFAALGTRSRMTVFRRLSTAGYLSSYSHGGRYYTLRDIPAFDADGLWQHRGVLFSRDGTLTRTLVRIVEEADAGQFHCELQLRVRLRVHNTLVALVTDHRLGRELFAGEYLYLSTNAARAEAQLARRTQLGQAASVTARGELTSALVIEVLVEIIHGTAAQIDATQVAARLVARGVSVTAAQVEEICLRHGVIKKTARSHSRRSLR